MNPFSPHQNVINYNAGGRRDRLLLGVIMIVLGESVLVTMGAVIKHIGPQMPLVQIIFFRNLLALLFILPMVSRIGFQYLKTAKPGIHFQRGILGVAAMFCMFYSFSTIKLSEAILLKSTSPILLSLVAWLVLREKMPRLAWLAIILAFAGVAITADPQTLDFKLQLGYVAGFSAALLAAFAKVMVRRLGRTEPSEVIIFYFAVCGSVFALPFAILQWQPISLEQWGFLLLIALLASFGQLFITKAYTVAKAGSVAIFTYLAMPIAAALGWFIWDESVDLPLIIGSIMVVAAGVLSFYANQRSRGTEKN